MKENFSTRSIAGFKQVSRRRGLVFGLILLVALLAFEIFNYSTTDFALTDLLGSSLRFSGLRWATILAIAFCGIDFAGIARLFTPEQGKDEPAEVWYLFAAWLLAATMNATLTWWGVTVAVHSHQSLGTGVVGTQTMYAVVPVFVAVMVWLIRVLIIGSFSMAGDKLFSFAEGQPAMLRGAFHPSHPAGPARQPLSTPALTIPLHQAPRPEPGYQPGSLAARSAVRHSFRHNGTPTTRT